MSYSNYTYLSYGVTFNSDFKFPWGENSLQFWWEEITKNKKIIPKCPVELIIYGNENHYGYILTTRSINNYVSYCQAIPEEFLVKTWECHNELIDFLKTHGIKTEQTPSWIFHSYEF